ncbi:hypothetical protein HETIRDRAFT_387930 [Heterobasidion irregulare TC 32-1]|uniref:Uncharacterized protein n=1 Tax=Heterobasidion irregulare (strain TC 32-1) TaxID=747525 RepID=W4JXT0_HETIT|nr:uncharacterized protein HETIRDRAFT_387930 [Heterobasidion irregulare TC 32-1]ETW77890.1 hypothetical protein HETIRDRAFT_387930 [Heterobasidion irregulare TC 32-1]
MSNASSCLSFARPRLLAPTSSLSAPTSPTRDLETTPNPISRPPPDSRPPKIKHQNPRLAVPARMAPASRPLPLPTPSPFSPASRPAAHPCLVVYIRKESRPPMRPALLITRACESPGSPESRLGNSRVRRIIRGAKREEVGVRKSAGRQASQSAPRTCRPHARREHRNGMHMCGMCMRACVRACMCICVYAYVRSGTNTSAVCVGQQNNKRRARARNQGRAAESEASKRKSRGRGRGKARQDGARGWACGKTGRDDAT